ncbi:hypothetical protein [Paraburkholderia phenoliruptrix]|uniref:hypothetical protein n=1 Tax=Paraburkholderia phenoliruptrix TaxID=252970 RepID=UPI0034CFDE67
MAIDPTTFESELAALRATLERINTPEAVIQTRLEQLRVQQEFLLSAHEREQAEQAAKPVPTPPIYSAPPTKPRRPASTKRYIIMELDDAKQLALNASAGFDERVARTIDRINAETGADMEDIVAQLKGIDTCHACLVEGQEAYCVCWEANKLGRRLSRLVDRANGRR